MARRLTAGMAAGALVLSGAHAAAAEPGQDGPIVVESPNTEPGNSFGWPVIAIGDVTGDGSTDFASAKTGLAAYVFDGRDGSLLHTFTSPQLHTAYGTTIAGLGDVDGDAVPDVAVGNPSFRAGDRYPGRVYVYSGATGALLRFVDHPAPPPSGNGEFGEGLVGVGDTNGNGTGDIAVGGRSDEVAGKRIFILDGGTGQVLARTDAGRYGIELTALGDVSGDGVQDFSADAESGEYTHVDILSGADASLLRSIFNPAPTGQPNDYFGFDVGAAPDVTGDGLGDLLITSNAVSVGDGVTAGRGYLVNSADGSVVSTFDDPHPRAERCVWGVDFGYPIVAAGDLTGDGVTEVLVSDSTAPCGMYMGRVYVFDGASGELLRSIDHPAPAPDSHFGETMAVLGDADGDGVTEVAIADYSAGGRVFIMDLPALGVVDTVAPVVTGSADRDPDNGIWYSAPVTVTWSAMDPVPSSGVASVPSPSLVDVEGAGQVITSGESCDPAGNCATGSLTVNLDMTAPTIDTIALAESVPFVLPAPGPVGISVGVSDSTSGVSVVEAFIGDDPGVGSASSLAGGAGSYSADLVVPTVPGTYSVGVRARDAAGNWSTTSVRSLVVADNDGVDSATEDAAPNGGDGNNDGTPDSKQVNVTSLPSADDPGAYLTVVSPEGTVLGDVQVVSIPAEIEQPTEATVSLGALSYTVEGVDAGATIDITVIAPAGSAPNSIYKYVNGSFLDASQYATFEGDRIVLHLTDGDPAVDEDGVANGTIVDPVVPFRLAPTISAVQVPQSPQRIGTVVTLSASFVSPAVSGPFDYRFLVDGAVVASGSTSAAGDVSASFTPMQADIGGVTFEVTNRAGDVATSSAPDFLVTYDPAGGFVTGGGWIDSPAGAYRPGEASSVDVTGKASFGFVAKYQKGATTPNGKTEFQFRAGDLSLASTTYEWLVVSSDRKATFRGRGTVNGTGDYVFQLAAYDGSPDRLRMKITDASGAVVYDNLPGAAEDSDPILGTALGGGSIQIQRK